jgi:hypothetical protein
MSAAIDFDLSLVRGAPAAPGWHTGQKERLLQGIAADGYRQELARAAVDADTPDPADANGVCGFGKPRPFGRVLEGCSAIVSLLCLIVVVVFACIGAFSGTEKMANIRMDREVMLFTSKQNMTHAMRHLQTAYSQYCKADNYTIDLQVPSWDPDNAHRAKSFSNATRLGMSVNIHSATISLFVVSWPIFLFSFLFQRYRYNQYCRFDSKKKVVQGLYKPWLGPEFSRWLEYLLTSPFQIFIVSTAFGFSNTDTVLGHVCMQGALVLLGYDIEQQTKKVYKRQKPPSAGYSENTRWRFHHVFAPGVRDIRGSVYLLVAWGLHLNIWMSIYTRYTLQERHGQHCEADPNFTIPEVVRFILVSQFVCFTLFGFFNSVQYACALLRGPRTPQQCRESWNFYSNCYSVLSVTSKTLLAIFFIWYIREYDSWPLAPDSSLLQSNLATGQQCWSVEYKRS